MKFLFNISYMKHIKRCLNPKNLILKYVLWFCYKMVFIENWYNQYKLRSTKSTTKDTSPSEDTTAHTDIVPLQEDNNPHTTNMLCSIIDSKDLQSKSYSDQTGKFPIKPVSGNQ